MRMATKPSLWMRPKRSTRLHMASKRPAHAMALRNRSTTQPSRSSRRQRKLRISMTPTQSRSRSYKRGLRDAIFCLFPLEDATCSQIEGLQVMAVQHAASHRRLRFGRFSGCSVSARFPHATGRLARLGHLAGKWIDPCRHKRRTSGWGLAV